jgi:hypothetical protein
VNKAYEAALVNGRRDNGAPGLRAQFDPRDYAANVLNPDRYNRGDLLQALALRIRSALRTLGVGAPPDCCIPRLGSCASSGFTVDGCRLCCYYKVQ